MDNTIKVDLKRSIYEGKYYYVRVRAEGDFVLMQAGDKVLKMRTPAAHKTGFSLVKKSGEALSGELIEMNVNGEVMQLLPEHARQIGGALLRKADDVDDYQLKKVRS